MSESRDYTDEEIIELVNNNQIVINDDYESETNELNLYVFGLIDSSTSESIIRSLVENESQFDENTNINIYICSEGGELYECFAIIDFFNDQQSRCNYTINTHGLGCVSSGGFFLFILGDNRKLYPKTRVFVHEHLAEGDDVLPYTKKLDGLKEEKILNKIYIQYVADKLEVSFRTAKALLQKDKWLNDKELQQYNIYTTR